MFGAKAGETGGDVLRKHMLGAEPLPQDLFGAQVIFVSAGDVFHPAQVIQNPRQSPEADGNIGVHRPQRFFAHRQSAGKKRAGLFEIFRPAEVFEHQPQV